MLPTILSILFFASIGAGRLVRVKALPGSSPHSAMIATATSSSHAHLIGHTPVPTERIMFEQINIRHARAVPPNPAPPAAPGVAPAVPAGPIIPPQAAPPAKPNPAAPVPPAISSPLPGDSVSVTVMWLETLIDKSVKSWYPKTVTVEFANAPGQAALPGKGEVGMGTLTGQPGVTKTVVAGAAPTRVMRYVGVAVGIGVAGLVL